MEKVGRNDPCPCGSGKKYKKCCGQAGPKKFTASVLSGNSEAAPLLDRMKGLTSSVMKAVGEVGGHEAQKLMNHTIQKTQERLSNPPSSKENEEKNQEDEKSS